MDWIAVVPYPFTFRAPVKGRWLDRALLSLFVSEFAYVGEDDEGTTDPRRSLAAYVEEMVGGQLRLERRGEESRAAGRQYQTALLKLVQLKLHRDGSTDVTWKDVREYLHSLPQPADCLELLHHNLPVLLPLRQKDVVLHDVMRQEGRLFAGEPLQLLGGAPAGGDGPTRLSLLLVGKPSGMPVHPSGRCRKNSVTSLVRDVLGGCDRQWYQWRESPADPETTIVSITHRVHSFELIRIRVHSSDCSKGIPTHIWHEIRDRMDGKTDDSGKEKLNQEDGAVLPLHVIHRLDAATSGVLLFALSPSFAREASQHIIGKTCQKIYRARVRGRLDLAAFAHVYGCQYDATAGCLTLSRPIGCLSHTDAIYWCPGRGDGMDLPHSSLLADKAYSSKRERMEVRTRGEEAAALSELERTRSGEGGTAESVQRGRLGFHSTMKESLTKVSVLHYDAGTDETVLSCQLGTGRTHQIRVHLASLGFPVIGDEKYKTISAYVTTAKRDDWVTLLNEEQGQAVWRPQEGGSSQSGGSSSSCACPLKILLHAWRYTMPLAEAGLCQFEAPPSSLLTV